MSKVAFTGRHTENSRSGSRKKIPRLRKTSLPPRLIPWSGSYRPTEFYIGGVIINDYGQHYCSTYWNAFACCSGYVITSYFYSYRPVFHDTGLFGIGDQEIVA